MGVSSRLLRVAAWASFVLNVLIIGTGGAVRLTGSGLGCDEWPLCTPESLTPTPEMGIHGIIEFGNRTITGVLLFVALAVLFALLQACGGWPSVRNALGYAVYGVAAGVLFGTTASLVGLPVFSFFTAVLLTVIGIAAVRSLDVTPRRHDLVILAWLVLIGVVAQAFVGGITVLTRLNAFIVGFHYVVSLVLVCVTAAFLVRLREAPGPRERAVPSGFGILAHVATLGMAVIVLMGVLTTASGPHSGDEDVVRDGFDATVLSHLHAWPGYITLVLVLVLLGWAAARRLRPLRWLIALLVLMLVQIAVGIFQARSGLPPLAVGVHMVLASLTAATMTVVVLRLKRPVLPAESAEPAG
ncbi:COX15/CtaA family protein [Leucobacter ruminantium]|uniref:COX15/CtaA family protein n=1 Tax=Leucobacter ruminantium TaxID=1289170 RepID=UPI003C7E88CE